MSTKKILLADDDESVVMMLENFLKSKNYDVISTGDGESCVTKAKTEKPDLIILDILMPKQDGTETLKFLREDPTTKDIPVIVLTILKTKDDETKDSTGEFPSVLAKPVDPKQLLDKIHEIIG